MADRTEQKITIAAPAAAVMAVIADFAAYPEWVGAAKSVDVLERDDQGRGIDVAFELDAGVLKDSYQLAYTWDASGNSVSWTLVRSNLQKAQFGEYALVERGGSTEVTYRLEVSLAIPMIGLLKRKAEKTITDTALKELKKRVESLAK